MINALTIDLFYPIIADYQIFLSAQNYISTLNTQINPKIYWD